MKLLIIAGTHNQAVYWLKENGFKPSDDIILISKASKLRGLRGDNIKYVLTGEYYKRDDFEQIRELLEFNQLKEYISYLDIMLSLRH